MFRILVVSEDPFWEAPREKWSNDIFATLEDAEAAAADMSRCWKLRPKSFPALRVEIYQRVPNQKGEN